MTTDILNITQKLNIPKPRLLAGSGLLGLLTVAHFASDAMMARFRLCYPPYNITLAYQN